MRLIAESVQMCNVRQRAFTRQHHCASRRNTSANDVNAGRDATAFLEHAGKMTNAQAQGGGQIDGANSRSDVLIHVSIKLTRLPTRKSTSGRAGILKRPNWFAQPLLQEGCDSSITCRLSNGDRRRKARKSAHGFLLMTSATGAAIMRASLLTEQTRPGGSHPTLKCGVGEIPIKVR